MAKAETVLLEDEIEDTEALDEPQDDLAADDQEDDLDDVQDDEGNDDAEEEVENEIVLDGDDGSHPPQDEQRGIRKRINKLNAKVAEAQTGAQQTSAELEVERERSRLLQLALDNQGGQKPDGPPDPNDFDDGVTDPAYTAAYEAHIAKGVEARVMQQGEQRTKSEAEQRQLSERQVAHYKRADALGVKDYDDTEDKAIAIFGHETVNQLILKSDKSPELLYYLGKNQGPAEELAGLIKSDPVKGVLLLGALEARLKARPKANVRNTPDPDGELSGGGPGAARQKRGPKGAKFE